MNARTLLIPSLLLALSLPSRAVEMTGNNPPDGLRGVLEAPTLFGRGPCTQRSGGSYTLRAAPSAGAPSVGTLEADPIPAGQNACSQDLLWPHLRKPGDAWSSPVPVREFKQGHPGLVLTEARPGWVHVMLGDGDAWLQMPPGSVTHDYGTIVVLSPVHTLRGWDGRLCANPQPDQCRRMAMPSDPAVRIDRVQTIGSEVWFKVTFGIGACEGSAMPGRDVLQGWIPAYGAPGMDGKRPLTVWMDPHGC